MSEPGSVAHKWQEEHPDAPTPIFTNKTMQHRKVDHLPKQDNYCDCGLFTLTYIHYFTYAPPSRFKYELELWKMKGMYPSHSWLNT